MCQNHSLVLNITENILIRSKNACISLGPFKILIEIAYFIWYTKTFIQALKPHTHGQRPRHGWLWVCVQLGANRPGDHLTYGYTDIRWRQTANYGFVPNPHLQKVFMAVAMDLPDLNSTHRRQANVHTQKLRFF